MTEDFLIDKGTDGNVKISENVLATIAYVTCEKIDGVLSLQSGLKQGALDMLGVKNQPRGIKVSVGEFSTVLDIYVVVEYGKDVVEIAKNIQNDVKVAIENMTGIDIVEINVHISGIEVPSTN